MMCIYGGHVHTYEVSMSNPVPREVCTDDADANANDADDDTQFMIA